MDIVTLALERREAGNSNDAGRIRRAGRVPGVVYGRKSDAIPVSMDDHELRMLLRLAARGNVMLDLKIPGETGEVKAIFREIQTDPVRDAPIHCDFQRISLTEKIHVRVHVHAIGVADGVKTFGGILDHHLREIDIRCLPTDVPDVINVDVTPLGIGDSIRVKDISFPGVEILLDPEAVVLSVVPPTILKETTAAAGDAPAATEATEPELIKKAKKEDDAEEPKEKEKKKS
ncbi:MAG: 50S ribosomal protein L25 [bacterium]